RSRRRGGRARCPAPAGAAPGRLRARGGQLGLARQGDHGRLDAAGSGVGRITPARSLAADLLLRVRRAPAAGAAGRPGRLGDRRGQRRIAPASTASTQTAPNTAMSRLITPMPPSERARAMVRSVVVMVQL